MDAAASAINNFLSGSGQSTTTKTEQEVAPAVETSAAQAPAAKAPVVDSAATGEKDTTVTQEVAPAVEHEHVKHEHETKEQTVIDRERHQDHYHTTIQPLADKEVEATKHDSETVATEERKINKDDQGDKVKAKVAADAAGFKSTHDEETHETKTKEPTITGESVHHHLHETIQPVIEKERIVPEVTHKVKPVHEVIKEQTKDHGVTTNKTISVDDFQGRLGGESTKEVKHVGGPAVTGTAETGITEK
ncbi:hypothetical protein D6C92_08222 [Aureobasidium pullulans]|uniref:Allergen n=1 Tax=Aureobasidium pullulans TaxID=5580 RepID=A0A4V4HYG1_AURPU|nr:hypothetical protein D6D28_09610 [Aureobasidium pullulans]THV91479.1 hypothetical protein D6D26_08974 [Aureobasidium pullulans]THW35424.1 hypothetical protein D6D22_08151 [Aureobasidium pullulans]THX58423.1 hypothetical protein D6D08_09066 [Aureobasidium pullulans]THX99937.1 hypothetical protein D6D03_06827 [Aureobasidium pullulans]